MPQSMFGRFKRRFQQPPAVIFNFADLDASTDGTVEGWAVSKVRIGDDVALISEDAFATKDSSNILSGTVVELTARANRTYARVRLGGQYVPPMTRKERGDAPEWVQKTVDAQMKFPGTVDMAAEATLQIAPLFTEAISKGADLTETCFAFIDACMPDFLEGVRRAGLADHLEELTLAFRGAMFLQLIEVANKH